MASLTEVFVPPEGAVAIEDKALPICELTTPIPASLCYTRGFVDMTKWTAKIDSIKSDPIWHAHDVDSKDTIKIARAAHDAWGIEKIIFKFCDDFLMKVITLPYAEQEDWKELLQPVYNALGVTEDRVVRCLLARMPANVQIPIHHDTGYWVQHTHRCHLALETNERIKFMVGPNPELMQQVMFNTGRIVELNNQAKHSVVNHMLEGEYRTHLILDYIEPSASIPEHPVSSQYTIDHTLSKSGYTPPARPIPYFLPFGSHLSQTRRSIDTPMEVQAYDVYAQQPRYIVIGAQKGGTTSLYDYLSQHPLICKGKRRESHFFDWRWDESMTKGGSKDSQVDVSGTEEDIQRVRKVYLDTFYHAKDMQQHPSISTGESTPSYLFHYDIVLPRLKRYVPWAKLLITLRDPVARAFSQYNMIIDNEGTPEQLQSRGHSSYRGMSFRDILKMEMDELAAANITADSSAEDFADHVLKKRRELKHGGHSVLIRGLYCFQVEAYMSSWSPSQLKVLIMELDLTSSTLPNTLSHLHAFLSLPPYPLEDLSVKNKRVYEPLDKTVGDELKEFYRPFNERLSRVLAKELPW